MGFRPQMTIFTVEFATNSELHGLEIRVSSITMGELMEIGEQAERAREGAGLSEVKDLIGKFVSCLISWNLENILDGQPTPTTMEGLLNHEPRTVLKIVLVWFDSMLAVLKNDPLDEDSNSGETFPEESLPMELPSQSPEN